MKNWQKHLQTAHGYLELGMFDEAAQAHRAGDHPAGHIPSRNFPVHQIGENGRSTALGINLAGDGGPIALQTGDEILTGYDFSWGSLWGFRRA